MELETQDNTLKHVIFHLQYSYNNHWYFYSKITAKWHKSLKEQAPNTSISEDHLSTVLEGIREYIKNPVLHGNQPIQSALSRLKENLDFVNDKEKKKNLERAVYPCLFQVSRPFLVTCDVG